MGSTQQFAEYIHGQLSGAGTVEFRKMFGEYAFYFDGKVVALVCDDRLFFRPTTAGREWIGTVTEAPPYPGAKLHFLIEAQLDDRPWLAGLVQATARELPVPKPKKAPAVKTGPADEGASKKGASSQGASKGASKEGTSKKGASTKGPPKKAAAKRVAAKKGATAKRAKRSR